ncbi:hypothetical protein CE91St56_23060 [Lachnospiraceae bacterium]|nr:hypothetical protein CE91St56_23060 [Lachnospiraceae bacterium]GKH41250.1 hypothetical protein CE91St57_22240 [Lachnospiraceae bacterium]
MSEILRDEIIRPLLALIQLGIVFRVAMKLIQAHGEEQGLSVAIKQCKRLILAGGLAICSTDILSSIQSCFSNGDDFFGGIERLLQQAAVSLTAFEITYVAFMLVATGIAWQQDPEDRQYRNKMVNNLLIGALIICATNMLPVIFGYFR